MREGVVLLHGIARTKYSMRGLEKYLEKHGYATLNIGYPSRRHTLQDLATIVHPPIQEFAEKWGKVHFVVHSMGGLIVRAYLKRYDVPNLGRIVMLGTPNSGSEVADFFRNHFWYKKFYGPAGQQLITDQSGFSDIFDGPVKGEIGIIAGIRRWDIICGKIIGQPNDGKVSITSSKLDGMKEHLIVSAGHSFMPLNRALWPQVLSFLKEGHF